MKALKIEPRKRPVVVDVENTLEALQKEVDGYIKVCHRFPDGVLIIGDEEAKLKSREICRVLCLFPEDEVLCGTLLILRSDVEAFAGLTTGQVTKYLSLFSERYVDGYADYSLEEEAEM